MPQELEIKLTLTPSASETAYRWLTSLPEASVDTTRMLINTYFDTSRAELNGQRAALRIRQAGDRYIQTLKTQGEFVSGAHRRQEWEWPLTEAKLNIGLLADTPLAENINLAELEPVFETNFERRVVMLDDGQAVIECAFDTGEIRSGNQSVPLCELEFELKSGDEQRLLHWVARVAEQAPFFINLISKAEQGYHLAGLHEPDPLLPDSDAVTRFFHGLSVLWLNGQVTDELRLSMGEIEGRVKEVGAPEDIQMFDKLQVSPPPELVGMLGVLQIALLA